MPSNQVLSRFSKAKGQVEFRSQEEFLEQIAKDLRVDEAGDSHTPYTFKDWHERNTGIIPGQEYKQYNDYLRAWYQTRFTPTSASVGLRADYVALLKQLTLAFKSDVDASFLAETDFDDDIELEEAIPFYARKLKEIALYLIEKRDAIKNAKLKYNISGADQALIKLFQEYLLKSFTRRSRRLNTTELSAYSLYPDLSSINSNFQIQIEELYDSTSYFDKDPRVGVSAYFSTSSSNVTSYFDSLNFQSSAIDWVFTTGFAELCANNPFLWTLTDTLCSFGTTDINEVPISAFDDFARTRLNDYYKFDLAQKYLGETQYMLSGGYFVQPEASAVLSFEPGNNWFHWPSGEYFGEVDFDNQLDVLSLSATTLITNGAVGNKDYREADKIFLVRNNSVSGAWLRSIENTTRTETMCARFLNSSLYHFKFPYPGYGISGEGIEWSGKQLSNLNRNFEFLVPEVQTAVRDQYWSDVTTTSAICSVNIHTTNLIANGAIANISFSGSDVLSVRRSTGDDKVHDSNPDEVYTGEFDHAWLYKMNTTDIPVRAGKQESIYWPTQRYDLNETISHVVPTSQSANVALSTIDTSNVMVGARAGQGLYDSDIIYKLAGKDQSPTECAWLSGRTFNTLKRTTFTNGSTGTVQPSLALRCNPGVAETFMWPGTGTSILPIDIGSTNITHKAHQANCKYLSLDLISLFKDRPSQEKNIDYEQWKDCECRAVYYSPLGHPGQNYDEFEGMADIIFVDHKFPTPFDYQTWRDPDGLDYKTSPDFAWFRLSGAGIEPDVGYGQGTWVNYDGTGTFYLSAGVQYKYVRTNLNRDTSLEGSDVAPLIIKQSYNNTHTTWMKANLSGDGTWSAASGFSDMVFKPGDYLLYDHIDSNWFCVSAVGDKGIVTSFPSSALNTIESKWMTYSWVTTGQQVRYAWPDQIYNNGPTLLASELSSVSWYVSSPSNTASSVRLAPTENLVVLADTVGTYLVSAIGYPDSIAASELYYATDSAVGLMSSVRPEAVTSPSGSDNNQTIFADTVNMVINIALSGWNTSTFAFDTTSLGGRPFWAIARDNALQTTKYKGISRFGGGIRFVDEYSLLAQPEFSDINLQQDDYVVYDHIGSSMTWQEPITFVVNETDKTWYKLNIDKTSIHPLSAYLGNSNLDLAVSATLDPSDLILSTGTESDPVVINYFAQQAFTWTQPVTNSSLGFPPSGGIFVPITSGVLIEPLVPYANLTNRHYPTFATIPYVGGLSSISEIGGYFVPSMLGILTYIQRDFDIALNTSKLANTNNRGISAVFQDPLIYVSDRGSTRTDQNDPVSAIAYDASWTKSGPSTGLKNGTIVNISDYQTFLGYQTKYESTKTCTHGIKCPADAFDPWKGPKDDEWIDPISSPANFRDEFNISGWYGQFPS